MTSIIQFTAKPVSRHPKHDPWAYDRASHAYAPGYVRPTKWGIQVVHTLSQEREDLKAKIVKINPKRDSPGFVKLVAEKAQLVAKLNAIESTLNEHEIQFTVSQQGGYTQQSVVNDYKPVLEVPAVGAYTITINAKKRNGSTSRRSENITFQDILIVSMGDSIAAGEGNPDRAGKPGKTTRKYAEQGAGATLKSIQEDISPITGSVPNVTPSLYYAGWQEPMAHRSYLSGHSLAAEQVEARHGDLHVVTTFLPFSRSGAKTDEGLVRYNAGKVYNERRLFLRKKLRGFDKKVEEYEQPGSLDYQLQTGQIDEARATIRNRKVDFLVLTIGANDIKWSSNFGNLIELDSEFSITISLLCGLLQAQIPASNGGGGDAAGRKLLDDSIRVELDKLKDKLESLNLKIRETLDPRFVLLTEYPRGFFGSTDSNGDEVVTQGCGVFNTPVDADIDLADAELIRDLSDLLNEKLKWAAEKFGWIWVDGIADEFAKHGYCAKDTYFVSAEKSFKTQGDWYGMLHPNAKGHNLYARRIAAKIRETIAANPSAFWPRPSMIPPLRDPMLAVTI